MKRVYLDYAASTPVDPRVLKAMQPYFSEKYANASSLHTDAQEARRAIENSRELMANLINAKSNELIFTSSTTEANNTALKGIAWTNRAKGKHIIVSKIEHECVLNSARWLQTRGFDVTFLGVDEYGFVDLDELERAMRKDTILVSIMHANNEIGTVEPIKEMGKLCREHGVLFHTDAAQTFGKLPIDVKKMNIDLMSISGHKIYGPKGIGGLFIRGGVRIEPLLHGGGHEFGLRSSTENTPAIVGFAEAAKIAHKEMDKESRRQIKLRDKLIEGALRIENSYLNGHPTKRLPNNANLRFDFIEGESLIMRLDAHGISASTGSACSSASLEPSHVLLALGLKPEQTHGSLRLSLGRWTTDDEIEYTLEVLPRVVENLRKISPFKK